MENFRPDSNGENNGKEKWTEEGLVTPNPDLSQEKINAKQNGNGEEGTVDNRTWSPEEVEANLNQKKVEL